MASIYEDGHTFFICTTDIIRNTLARPLPARRAFKTMRLLEELFEIFPRRGVRVARRGVDE